MREITISFLRGIRAKNCPICGHHVEKEVTAEKALGAPSDIAKPVIMLTHLQEVHPDFLSWQETKMWPTIALGVTTAVLTFSLLYLTGIFGSVGWIGFGSFFIPLIVMGWLGTRRFRRQWREKGLPPTPTFAPARFPGQSVSDNDGTILDIARELSTQLGITGTSIRKVRWQTLIPQGRGLHLVRSDDCAIRDDTIYFAKNMIGELTPEQWRPIIASRLIYDNRPRTQMSLGILIRLAPILILYTSSWFIIPPLFPTTTNTFEGQTAVYNHGWTILLFGGIGLGFLAIAIGWRYAQKVRLAADRQASTLIGVGSFLESLRRVKETSPSDARDIEKRIANLIG